MVEQHRGRTSEASLLHTPVMLDRCIDLLAPALSRPNAVMVDCTLGMGGHSEAMLSRFEHLTVIGLDRDAQALQLAGERLAPFASRTHLIQAEYDRIGEVADDLGLPRFDGVLFDLGVSSLQLDAPERGFAYAQDAPLDMRMNQMTGETAADILASASEGRLRQLFEDYGDEPLAGRYARVIIAARERQPLERSGQLVEVLQRATPEAVKRKRHPAKRVFQALHIEVNNELGSLEKALPRAFDRLKLGGRAVVLSYQSLEDRLVKREFASRSRTTAPAGLPVELPEHRAQFTQLTRGAEFASDAEQESNSRAIPVRLRAIERTREAV